jgi:hypothetical protein
MRTQFRLIPPSISQIQTRDFAFEMSHQSNFRNRAVVERAGGGGGGAGGFGGRGFGFCVIAVLPSPQPPSNKESNSTAHEGGDEHDKPSELIGVTATRLGNPLQCIASP